MDLLWTVTRYAVRGVVGALIGMFLGGGLGFFFAAVIYGLFGYGGDAPDSNALVGVAAAFWGGVVGLVVGATIGVWLCHREIRGLGRAGPAMDTRPGWWA